MSVTPRRKVTVSVFTPYHATDGRVCVTEKVVLPNSYRFRTWVDGRPVKSWLQRYTYCSDSEAVRIEQALGNAAQGAKRFRGNAQ